MIKKFLIAHKITGAIIIGILSSAVIIFLINLIIIAPSSIKVAENNDWIGFYGSFIGAIIGGIITWFSLFVSLNYYRNKDKEDRVLEEEKKRISILPYFSVKPIADSEEIGEVNEITFSILRDLGNGRMLNIRSFKFELTNIGLGTAVDAQIKKLYLFDDNVEGPSLNFPVGYKELFEISADFPEEGYRGNTLWLTIFYSDLLGNKYSQYISVRIYYTENEDTTRIWVTSTSNPELINTNE